LTPITIIGTPTQATKGATAAGTATTPNESDPSNNTSISTPQDILGQPDLLTTITNNAPTAQVGQPMSYTMTVSNVGAGPVLLGNPITATFTPPDGMSNVKATDGSDWDLSIDPQTGKVTATYKGPYPVDAGLGLTPITITGTPTKMATGATGTGTVTTPNESNPDNNTSAGTPQDIAPAPDLAVTEQAVKAPFRVNMTGAVNVQVTNNSAAGPVPANSPIVVNITVPKMTQLNATGTDWDISVDANAGTIKATYKGSYPVHPGAALSPITITGVPMTSAVPQMVVSSTLVVDNDSNPKDNTASTPIQVQPVKPRPALAGHHP